MKTSSRNLLIGLFLAAAMVAVVVASPSFRSQQQSAHMLELMKTLESDLPGSDGATNGDSGLAAREGQFIGMPLESFESWQSLLRSKLTNAIYDLDFSEPSRPELHGLPYNERPDGNLVRRTYNLPSPVSGSIPVVVLYPEKPQRDLPAVLVIPGHVADGESGLAQLVDSVDSYQMMAARKFAERGLVSVSIELPGFGLRGAPAQPDHIAVAYNAMLDGSFYKRVVFEELKAVVDFMTGLDGVDATRLGASGVSLGGEMSLEYAALDLRLKAVSFHAHGGKVGPLPLLADIADGQPHYCHIVPGINRLAVREDLFLLMFPRAMQGIRGERQPMRDDRFAATLEGVWQQYGRGDQIDLHNESGAPEYEGHLYFVNSAADFMLRVL